MTGFGASRRAISNVSNDNSSGWAGTLYSCIAMLKPFSVRLITNTNDLTWITDMVAKPGTWAITWPLESGYSVGGTLTFTGAITDKSFGAADIESRIEGEITITPSGAPVAVAGTYP